MATRPNMAGAPSGASNIVRLPTAAPRRVDNMRYSEHRRACKLARAETASRFDYKLPSMRETVAEEQRRDEALTGLERSPALFLIMAMLKAADPLTRTKVCAYSGDAVVRWPECRDTWLAHQVAMAMAGYVEESR